MNKKSALLLLLLILLSGCVPIHHNGKTYHLVIGLGVVRTSETNGITVVKASSAGVYAGDGHFSLGLSSIYTARVPTNANAVLEITK